MWAEPLVCANPLKIFKRFFAALVKKRFFSGHNHKLLRT